MVSELLGHTFPASAITYTLVLWLHPKLIDVLPMDYHCNLGDINELFLLNLSLFFEGSKVFQATLSISRLVAIFNLTSSYDSLPQGLFTLVILVLPIDILVHELNKNRQS